MAQQMKPHSLIMSIEVFNTLCNPWVKGHRCGDKLQLDQGCQVVNSRMSEISDFFCQFAL